MHTLNKYGSMDWLDLANKLSKIKQPVSLDYEVMMVYRKDETPQQVLSEVIKQANELENMIEESEK